MTHVTKRLILRPLVTADAPWIAQDIAHPEVQRWLTSPPHPYRLQDAQDFIARFGEAPGICVVEQDGQPQGVVSIERGSNFDPARDDQYELGYWLAPRAWGQGLMTDAARALIRWHFSQTADGIGSGWIDGNKPSENVLTKLGFTRTGETLTRRAHFLGCDVPVIRVAVSRLAWQALENPEQTR